MINIEIIVLKIKINRNLFSGFIHIHFPEFYFMTQLCSGHSYQNIKVRDYKEIESQYT